MFLKTLFVSLPQMLVVVLARKGKLYPEETILAWACKKLKTTLKWTSTAVKRSLVTIKRVII
jgi:hypothetical protein